MSVPTPSPQPGGVSWALIDWVDPEALFRAGPGARENAFWLDAGPNASDGWSWLGAGDAAACLPREVALAEGTAAASSPAVPGGFVGGWVGWVGYDGAARGAGAPAAVEETVPEEAAIVARRLVAFDHTRNQAWVIAPPGDLPDALAEVAAWSEVAARLPASALDDRRPAVEAAARHRPQEYARLVEECRAVIRAGDAYQLCLTTRFTVAASTASVPLDPITTYLRLRRAVAAHHGGLIRIGDHALVSASPERFLHVEDGIVRTRPIKGTRPRGRSADEDAGLARELRESTKERAENVMIVDLMRNDLQRVCLSGTVAVERLLEIESYPAVHQLVSTVAGQLQPGTTLGGLLAAALPAGSMTGTPKLSAMTLLNGLEKAPRGVYAGCFGWVGIDGRADLAMTIRTIVMHPAGAYVGAGGGITWLSVAAEEVAEVALKARGPLAALGAQLPAAWGRTDASSGVR